MADASPEVHRLSRFLFFKRINNDIFPFLIAHSDLVVLTRAPDTLYRCTFRDKSDGITNDVKKRE
jgi:hypothetical protein